MSDGGDDLLALRLAAGMHGGAVGVSGSADDKLTGGKIAYAAVAVVKGLNVESLVGVEVVVAAPGEGAAAVVEHALVFLLILEETGVGRLYVVVAGGDGVVALQQGLPGGLQILLSLVIGVLVKVAGADGVGVQLGGSEGVKLVLWIYVGGGAAACSVHSLGIGCQVVEQGNLARADGVFAGLHDGEGLPRGVVLIGGVGLVGHGDDAAGAATEGIGA